MTLNLINDILSDMWSYDLVLMGILLSLFILFYSFIIAKRDELRIIATEIKNKGIDPTLKLREQHAIAYIKNFQKLNSRCIMLLLVSSIHAVVCWGECRIVPNECLKAKQIMFYCTCGFSLIITFLLVWQIILIFKQYKQYTKI